MRRCHVALCVLVVVCGGGLARSAEIEKLVWDNFLTAPNGFDPSTLMTSEENATVFLGGSWTADDVDFTSYSEGLKITKIRWAGAYLEGYDYSVQISILKNDPNYTELAAISVPTLSIVKTFDLAPGGYRRYIADVYLPDDGYQLAGGNYFIGVRLVSEHGRNFMAGTGSDVLNPLGHSMGIFKSLYWGYPNWIPIDEFAVYAPGHLYHPPTDWAFQVYVPEPAAVLLVGAGILFLRRR
jgi:hypothetical protein